MKTDTGAGSAFDAGLAALQGGNDLEADGAEGFRGDPACGAVGGGDVGVAAVAGDAFGEAFAQDGALDDAGAVAAGRGVQRLIDFAPPGGAVHGQGRRAAER